MKVLNLYAGIGGNRKLWDDVDVTAVENVSEIADLYKQLYPNDTVIVADAHQYLLDHFQEFDFIWSSPPCPTHSRARYGLGFHSGQVEGVYPDMRLYQEIIFLKHHFEGAWVVENVQAYYDPLITPQSIGRHWYWTSSFIPYIKVDSLNLVSTVTTAGNRLIRKSTEELQDKLGIDLSPYKITNKRLLLRNAVEPEVGLHIFNAVGLQRSETVTNEQLTFSELVQS